MRQHRITTSHIVTGGGLSYYDLSLQKVRLALMDIKGITHISNKVEIIVALAEWENKRTNDLDRRGKERG
jgi:hypothetical protein